MTEIYVSNLSYATTEDELKVAFEQFGKVVSSRIITDRETGRSRGFAFVAMGSEAEATAAIEAMDGHDLAGRRVNVKLSRGKEHRPQTGRPASRATRTSRDR